MVRILVDLQACQTESSKDRGVGQYSAKLAQSMASHASREEDFRFCLNADLDRVRPLVAMLDDTGGRQRVSTYSYPLLDRTSKAREMASTGVAEALIHQHWLTLQPDILHVCHLFEGFSGDAVVPGTLPQQPGLVRSATLYDLIPLRFPEHYLADSAFKRWYLQGVGTLRTCDHVLAISESSRTDAVDLLGIAPERITTIHAGVDACFRPAPVKDEAELRRRLGLKSRFILYTGGDDFRKNLEGAVRSFADVSGAVRRQVQLVIACAMGDRSRSQLLRLAAKVGLTESDVVLTGYVATEDLLALYRLCDAFIFPSLYEGFGLPVLEAMSCGAPVLGSDNSSIREIIGRSDALFDPRRASDLAAKLTKVLIDEGYANDLRRHGLARAQDFSWQRSAEYAVSALVAAHQRASPREVTVAAIRLARRRLAAFTPLPPSRSGIADYSAAFLPFLERYFDIDVYVDESSGAGEHLGGSIRVLPHGAFAAQCDQYELILYDLGNSEFHAYMLDYIERYPGVIVLHDAYLGGLYGHMEFALGQSGRFEAEMLKSHGTRARRLLAPLVRGPNSIRDAMVHLPATKTAIESAIGVISHSPFNLDLAVWSYPEGFATPYRIIPQPVRIPVMPDAAARRKAKQDLGLDPEDFLICTFGHCVWTKCGDVLLDAFSRTAVSRLPQVRLIYVGELAGDAYGDALGSAVASHEFSSRITITGFMEPEIYGAYLRAADLAVQLRIHSRGGTPKGVLDCLANQVPVIVNNDASYTDYPDDVVIKLPPTPSADDTARKIDELFANAEALGEFRFRGREYVARIHAPDRIASEYALAIDEFSRRSSAASLQMTVQRLGAAVAADPGSLNDRASAAATEAHRAVTISKFARQRVLVDVSHLTAGDHRTGIQRVVRSIVRQFYLSERRGFVPIAVRLVEGKLVVAQGWLAEEGLLLDCERGMLAEEVTPQWGDCLLMLDSSWERYEEFTPIFSEVRRACGVVYTAIYDLLPMRFPQFWPAGAEPWFRGWLRRAIDESDGLVCISRAVADEVDAYVGQYLDQVDATKRLGFWHLGCNGVGPLEREDALTERVEAATRHPRTLLMVGTLEPRKGHALALSAMESLWADGGDAQLCIAGKQGWLVEDLIERIRTHPELEQRLHYLEDATDGELVHCYRRSAALLMPSAGEGYGLPLVEAANFGTPIIASDLPVFREIAGPHATYFALGGAKELAEVLKRWLDLAVSGDVPSSSDMQRLTWEQSAEQLLDVILDNRWYTTLQAGRKQRMHSDLVQRTPA